MNFHFCGVRASESQPQSCHSDGDTYTGRGLMRLRCLSMSCVRSPDTQGRLSEKDSLGTAADLRKSSRLADPVRVEALFLCVIVCHSTSSVTPHVVASRRLTKKKADSELLPSHI